VYPVLSRRSHGLSIGVNLNPDKVCNFDCIYCQVDRKSVSEVPFVELPQLIQELTETLRWAVSGEIYQHGKFRDTPRDLRRLNDLAFSGDGEPTTYKNFDQIVQCCAELKQQLADSSVKMVLITNASMFHRPHVIRGLEILDQNRGEIWAKLDAGTEPYFRRVERTSIPFERILRNICQAALVRPLVIQSLFMRIGGESPPAEEIEAYCAQLNQMQSQGAQFKLVQVYTIARRPAEDYVKGLDDQQVDWIRDQVQSRTGITAVSYYGSQTVS
jgi:wyosine [tRNA(Phe)-imidazoG37] synthetase (radical SAM superfamily)